MINVGDLVEWTTSHTFHERLGHRDTKRPAPFHDFAFGVVFREKVESLDGINKTKLFEVHFPNRQQYWIAAAGLKKLV
tara:strand:- start:143 stop:376 length:234 start_codon:yes stop_codon:yes gene_type:complete